MKMMHLRSFIFQSCFLITPLYAQFQFGGITINILPDFNVIKVLLGVPGATCYPTPAGPGPTASPTAGVKWSELSDKIEKGGRALSLSNDGTRVAVGFFGSLTVFDFVKRRIGRAKWVVSADLNDDISGWIETLQLTPDGRHLLVGETSGEISLFHQANDFLWLKKNRYATEGTGKAISISDDALQFAVGIPEKSYVQIFGLNEDAVQEWNLIVKGTGDYGIDVHLEGSGAYVIISDGAGTVEIVDTKYATVMYTIKNDVSTSVMASSGPVIGVGYTDSYGMARVQFYRRNKIGTKYHGIGSEIVFEDENVEPPEYWLIKISSDGERAAMRILDDTIHLYSINQKDTKLIGILGNSTELLEFGAEDIAISGDGTLVVYSDDDNVYFSESTPYG